MISADRPIGEARKRWAVAFHLFWFAAPFAIVAAYLSLAANFDWARGKTIGVGAIIMTFLAAAIGVLILPISRARRAVMMLPYLLVLSIPLVVWAVIFQCNLFGCAFP